MIKRIRLFFVMLCAGILLCSCMVLKEQGNLKVESDTQKEQSSKSSNKRRKSNTEKKNKKRKNNTEKKNQDSDKVQNDEVINNGAYFVKIGSDIYFRKYGESALEKNALFGEFLNHPTSTGTSRICRLKKDGETENLFEDSGYGELYYSNQRLYLSEMTGDGSTKSYSVNMDGKDRKELGVGGILGISEDGHYLAIGDYGSICVMDLQSEETPYIWASEENSSVEFLGFVQNGFLLESNTDSEDGYNVTSGQIFGRRFEQPEENIIIGDLNKNEELLSYPEFKGLTEDGKDCYLTFGYYGGTGHFLESAKIYKARLEQNSLELIQQNPDTSEEMYNSIPLIFASNGKLHIVSGGSDGELDIDGGSIYQIDQNGRKLLISDLFNVDPNSQIEQSVGRAEIVDGDLFLMVFRQIYTPYQDVGWRMSYSLLDTQYLLVRKGSNEPELFDQWSNDVFKQNAEVWKVGESTLLYRPLSDNPDESDFSRYVAYTVSIPVSVNHNFTALISSLPYTEYGELELPDSEGEILQLIFDHTGALKDVVQE